MDRPPSQPITPPTHKLDIYTDAAHAKDVVKGILHTIFFHRTFPPVSPISRDIPDLDTTLPAIDDVDLEQLIDDRAAALSRQLLDTTSTPPSSSPVHANLAVQFFEKRRKRSTYAYNFFGLGGGQREGGNEDICWEVWVLDVTLANERDVRSQDDLRGIMERSVHRAAMNIVEVAGREREHIPPITTASESNPFPYEIMLGEKGKGLTFPVAGRTAGIW